MDENTNPAAPMPEGEEKKPEGMEGEGTEEGAAPAENA